MEVIIAEAESDEDEPLGHETCLDEGRKNVAIGVEAEIVAASEHDAGGVGHLSVHLQQPTTGL